jgi:hypothetical protein
MCDRPSQAAALRTAFDERRAARDRAGARNRDGRAHDHLAGVVLHPTIDEQGKLLGERPHHHESEHADGDTEYGQERTEFPPKDVAQDSQVSGPSLRPTRRCYLREVPK